MKLYSLKLAAALVGLGFASSASALEIPAAITKSDCLACHSADKKVVGPSFLDIANKYRGQSVSSTLVTRVKNGSKGVWGNVAATPHKFTSDEQIREGVQWILNLQNSDLEAPAEGGAAVSPAALANKIMKGSDCFACHMQDSKLIGPSYEEIKAKYGEKDVAALVKKIKDGGAGIWGSIPMTPHPDMKDKDLELVTRWILGLTNEKAAAPKAKVAPQTEKAAPSAQAAVAKKGPDKTKAEALLNGSGCMACHQAKTRVIGPSWVEIAEKYKGDASKIQPMVKKIKEGGSGAWGAMPMIPHPALSEADLTNAVEYIMTFK